MRTASNGAIVNMTGKSDNISALMDEEYCRISLRSFESKISECSAENVIPFMTNLFESVDQFEEINNVLLAIRFLVPMRLLHEDFFI